MDDDKKYLEITIPKGATLGGLASQYGTTVPNVLKLNPQITNPDVIQAGATLKIPKIEVVSTDYQNAFQEGLLKLYNFEYGTQGAREKLLTDLEKRFPNIDIAQDVYEKIPDNWEKNIPSEFKAPEAPKPVVEPEPPETSMWKNVTSWIDDHVAEPFKNIIISGVQDFKDEAEDEPDEADLFDLAKTYVGGLFAPITKIISAPFNRVPETKIPKVGESPKEEAETEMETPQTNVFSMGEQVKLGDYILTVNSVDSCIEDNEIMQPEAGNKYVVADVTQENNG